jgi:uncharacterized protein YdeI (BOF family)
MKNIVLALLSLTLLAPLVASARPYHLTSVRYIVNTRNNIDVDDRYVTLIGHVTRRITDEEYWFADNTGQVRLDSENFDLPIGRTIVLGGRIDQAYLGIGHLEVDVRNWHYYIPLHRTAPIMSHPVVTRTTTTTVRTVSAPAPVTIPAPSPVMTPPPAPATNTTTLAPPTETAPVPTSDTNSGPTH